MSENCQHLQQELQDRVSRTLLPGSDFIAYEVADQVILAGQPAPADWERLAQQGVKLIINVRSDPQRAADQEQGARAAGLDYIHLQVPAYQLEAEHVHAFANALQRANEEKVIVHCRTASRVALLWMLKRMVQDHWTQEQAELELEQAGYKEDDMEVFRYCTEDFLEREATLELIL